MPVPMLWKANGSGMCRSTSRNRRRDPSHAARIPAGSRRRGHFSVTTRRWRTSAWYPGVRCGPNSAERSVTFGEDSGRIAPERSLPGHGTPVADERVGSGCSVGAGRHGIVGRTGPYMSVTGTVGGWFGPGDDVGRAWDEAEAI